MESLKEAESSRRRLRLAMPPAFRYPAYRAFWLGTLASVSGFQMLQFAQLWLVHQLTGSALFLGYVGAANAIPAILLNLFGGVFADKLNKRRLIMATQTTSAGLTLLLGTLTLFHVVRVEHVLIIALFTGAVQAFDQPARQALFPLLIDRKALMNAVALNASIWQGTRIVAPATAGVIIALLGTEAAFYATTAGFLTMAAVIYSLKVPVTAGGAHGSPLREIAEGLQFIKGNTVFSFLIGMTFFNSFFGMAYITLMPVFAVDILKVGAEGQGALLSAGGIGALTGALWMSAVGNFPRKGLLLIGGAATTGLFVAAFALTAQFVGYFPLALAIMPLIGICTSAYMISVMTSLQTMVPDHMRGRIMGFYGMTYNIMPLGGMQAGAIASVIGAPFAIAIGGLAVAAFALGPALVNSKVRNLGTLLRQFEETARPRSKAHQPAAQSER